MNKFVFGAIAAVALCCIGFYAVQSNSVTQTTSPDKAETPVTSVAAEGCCAGCCSEKSALVSTEATESSCCASKSACCSSKTSEVAAKAECCSSKTSEVSAKTACCSENKECKGSCQEDSSKCCQLEGKKVAESTTEVGTTSEESEGTE